MFTWIKKLISCSSRRRVNDEDAWALPEELKEAAAAGDVARFRQICEGYGVSWQDQDSAIFGMHVARVREDHDSFLGRLESARYLEERGALAHVVAIHGLGTRYYSDHHRRDEKQLFDDYG